MFGHGTPIAYTGVDKDQVIRCSSGHGTPVAYTGVDKHQVIRCSSGHGTPVTYTGVDKDQVIRCLSGHGTSVAYTDICDFREYSVVKHHKNVSQWNLLFKISPNKFEVIFSDKMPVGYKSSLLYKMASVMSLQLLQEYFVQDGQCYVTPTTATIFCTWWPTLCYASYCSVTWRTFCTRWQGCTGMHIPHPPPHVHMHAQVHTYMQAYMHSSFLSEWLRFWPHSVWHYTLVSSFYHSTDLNVTYTDSVPGCGRGQECLHIEGILPCKTTCPCVLSPFLIGQTVSLLNIFWTVQQTIICFLLELRQTFSLPDMVRTVQQTIFCS